MSEPVPRPGAAERLALLVLLQQRLRQAPSLRELGYLLVNELGELTPHRTAFLWLALDGGGRLAAVSSLPEPAREATFTQWARRLGRYLARHGGDAPAAVNRRDLPHDIAADWGDYLPPQATWVPLPGTRGPVGGLLLARDTAWPPEDLRLLGHVAEAAGHAAEALWLRRRLSPLAPFRRQPLRRAMLALLLLAGLGSLALPVPLTALAPAEVVPVEPLPVRAPLAGVIDTVLVEPNQPVHAGQLLFRLDDVTLRTKLDVVRQDLEVAQAEYRQAEQAALGDRRASAKLPLLASRIEQHSAEVAYTESLLERIEVKAERDGIVLMPEAHSLEGMPVVLGERILTIADPGAAELEMWIPVDDSIPLPEAATVSLFLNVAPDTIHTARLIRVDYQARQSPQGILGFRAVAEFTAAPPRIGLRGTARLSGETVRLATYLFRRPWAALRPWLGL